MLVRAFAVTRCLGVALATLIVLNLVLALEDPALSLTRLWLDLHFPEPHLSIFTALLSVVLFVPHDVARAPWCRWLLSGVVFGFWILVLANVVGYYHRLSRGDFTTDLPVPFCLFVWVVLSLEFTRITWCRSLEPRMPPPAWCFLHGLGLALAFFVLVTLHIITAGRIDHRQPADAVVILGAKVYDDGTVCGALRDRLDTGLELYREGLVSHLILSGGIGKNGISEPEVMAAYLQEKGGVPRERMLLDELGNNTKQSAVNCGKIAREHGFAALLTVSQYFHCARVQMIFGRAGTPCLTVPTCSRGGARPEVARLSRESFFLFREAVAFPFYFLYYR